jgi:hypothetical protein
MRFSRQVSQVELPKISGTGFVGGFIEFGRLEARNRR